MLWPDDVGGSAGLENCPDTIGADMPLCVVKSRGEGDTVEKQPDGPGGVDAGENPRFVVGQRDAQRNVLGGIYEPVDDRLGASNQPRGNVDVSDEGDFPAVRGHPGASGATPRGGHEVRHGAWVGVAGRQVPDAGLRHFETTL
jgi:hypothetical protein